MTIQNNTLRNIPFFSDLPAHDKSTLVKMCCLQHFNPHQQIVAQDAHSRNIHFILSGKVKSAYHIANKREVVIWEHSKGDALGLLSLKNGKYRTARATTMTSVTVLSMTRQEFNNALEVYPQISVQLNFYLVNLLSTLSERIIEFDVLDVNSRIYAELIRIASTKKIQNNRVIISPIPTHSEIACRISTHREAVTRELNKLESIGLIQRQSKTLTVLDLNKLKKMLARSFGDSCQ